MFEYLTAGESHGPRLTAVIKSLPSGLEIEVDKINKELARRQHGYGRGQRMEIESDQVLINSGLRNKKTLASPLSMTIENRDWKNWKKIMEPLQLETEPQKLTNPRPGHADLAGALKYNQKDLRNILERASARETAARTAVGAIAKQFLAEFGIVVASHVIQIGNLKSESWSQLKQSANFDLDSKVEFENYFAQLDQSPLRCANSEQTKAMQKLIDSWQAKGDSVGGVFEIIVRGLPVGLGSHVHWDLKLESKLAAQLMAIQAIKGLEIGAGFEGASQPGSLVHDQIYYQPKTGFYRGSNQAGGIEGGISNGQNLLIKLAMKPIPTLAQALASVDMISKKAVSAAKERSDACAVPAASIVGEAVTAIVLAQLMTAKFGGDSLSEIKRNYQAYLKQLSEF
ncbi:chorismate synthase [Halanaerobium praevalens]|uniref:Chorismate synthase n=1 Tax=Halanaerobium praevalens (strain ATCC 33744 / DSM 2228 / GSL) TaxID=572479 RepID=E3DRQ5_HALPG|nr:chorismate synthase [Halanaerobium praevalens]ADO78119.1 chorismate synthase [Halanaerobium praevalens DSM 2228]